MYPKLRLLAVTFDTQLESWELPNFRAAISQKVGLQHEWFHNHDNATATESPDEQPLHKNPKFHYRYALIQYKCLFNNPMLLCLHKGVDEAHHFFSQPDWSLRIGKDTRPMPIKKLELKEFDLHANHNKTYRIYNWMPLNSDDYRHFQSLTALSDILHFLQSRLLSHILSYTEGIEWDIKKTTNINAKIIEFLPERFVSFKGQKMQTFNFIFETNLPIPDMVGLGRGVSHGFGTVRPYAMQPKNYKK
jgi:hypothetical protein